MSQPSRIVIVYARTDFHAYMSQMRDYALSHSDIKDRDDEHYVLRHLLSNHCPEIDVRVRPPLWRGEMAGLVSSTEEKVKPPKYTELINDLNKVEYNGSPVDSKKLAQDILNLNFSDYSEPNQTKILVFMSACFFSEESRERNTQLIFFSALHMVKDGEITFDDLFEMCPSTITAQDGRILTNAVQKAIALKAEKHQDTPEEAIRNSLLSGYNPKTVDLALKHLNIITRYNIKYDLKHHGTGRSRESPACARGLSRTRETIKKAQKLLTRGKPPNSLVRSLQKENEPPKKRRKTLCTPLYSNNNTFSNNNTLSCMTLVKR